MRADPAATALRLGVALFLFSLTVGTLYLIGASQSFSEVTLRTLFLSLRWLAWSGMILSLLVLLPWGWRRKRFGAPLLLGAAFGTLFAFVLVWGSWVYPNLGLFPW